MRLVLSGVAAWPLAVRVQLRIGLALLMACDFARPRPVYVLRLRRPVLSAFAISFMRSPVPKMMFPNGDTALRRSPVRSQRK
jgi:hypothetical protein